MRFFFASRRRHTRWPRDWSSDVCSSDLYRGEHERSLSSNWQGLGKTRGSLSEHIPLWVLACIVAGGLLLTYTGFNYWLYTNSTPVVERLEEVTRSIDASRGL